MKIAIAALLIVMCFSCIAECEFPIAEYAIPEGTFVNSILKLSVRYGKLEGTTVGLTGYVTLGEEGEPFFVGRDYRCCGADTTPYGFFCVWAGDIPAEGAWVEVVGYLTKYENSSGIACLALDVIDIREAEEGLRIVTS